MSFADDFASEGLPGLYSEFGQTVAYTVAGSAAANVTAIIREEEQPDTEDRDGPRTRRMIRVRVQASSVTRPARGDSLVYDGCTWGFREARMKRQSGEWFCIFGWTAPVNKTHGNREVK